MGEPGTSVKTLVKATFNSWWSDIQGWAAKVIWGHFTHVDSGLEMGVAQIVYRYITSNVQKHEQKKSLVLKRYHWKVSGQPRCQRVSSPEWSRRSWIKSWISKYQLLSSNVGSSWIPNEKIQVASLDSSWMPWGPSSDRNSSEWYAQFMVNHSRISVRKECNYLRLTLTQ